MRDVCGGRAGLKRQFRIEKGRLVFMLDTSLNTHDAVWQEELGRAADEKMRSIVATIQRDQNAMIRNDRAPVLIIQRAMGRTRGKPRSASAATDRTVSCRSVRWAQGIRLFPTSNETRRVDAAYRACRGLFRSPDRITPYRGVKNMVMGVP